MQLDMTVAGSCPEVPLADQCTRYAALIELAGFVLLAAAALVDPRWRRPAGNRRQSASRES